MQKIYKTLIGASLGTVATVLIGADLRVVYNASKRHTKSTQEVVESVIKYPIQTEEDKINHVKTTVVGKQFLSQVTVEYLEKALRDKGVNLVSVKAYPDDNGGDVVFRIEYKYPETEDGKSNLKRMERILMEIDWEFE